MSGSLRLVIIAGEPSGDRLGAELLEALRSTTLRSLTITGLGGESLMGQGLQPLFSSEEIAIIGVSQIVTRLPKLLNYMGQIVDHIMAVQPDAVVLIDSPAFNHPIAKRLKRRGFSNPVIKFVAPQVWASRPWRARRIARYIDHVLTLFPFEPQLFEAHGLPATFVGHPVTKRPVQTGSGPAFRRRHNIPLDSKLVCVLPGSRRGEIQYLLPVFLATIEQLCRTRPDLQAVIPLSPNVAEEVRQKSQGCNFPLTFVDSDMEKFQAFDASDVAIAASGTVTLELAMARLPMVMAYKTGAFNAFVMRRFLLLPYVTLINILLERFAIPELIQEDCAAPLIAEQVERLLVDEAARQDQMAAIDQAVKLLSRDGMDPARVAAETVMQVIEKESDRS